MYRILIVEDELHAREGLRDLLAQKPEYTVEAACNGLEGLDRAESFRPDIIITDIKMPDMDGLSMVEELKNRSSPAEIVVLSGYAEFDYAQTAIRLGVVDYILKPIVPHRLFEQLEQCRGKIDLLRTRRQDQEEPPLFIPLASQEDLPLLERRFAHKKGGAFTAAVLYPVGEGGELAGLQEFVRGQPDTVLLKPGVSGFVGLLTFSQGNRLLAELRKQPFYHAGTVCVYACGERLEDAYEILSRLCRQIWWSISLGSSFFREDHCRVTAGNPPGEITGVIRGLFFQGQYGECQRQLCEHLAALQHKGYHPNSILLLLSTCILKYEPGVLQSQGLEEDLCYAQAIHSIMQARVPEEAVNIISAYYQLGCVALGQAGIHSRPVVKALREIEQNFAQPITLGAIAESIGITPQYLSKLFSREIGYTFVDYLTQYRIGKAKEMIASGDLKIYQIAQQVGYPDVKYFSTLFKKVTGQSPNRYRYAAGDQL